MFECPYSVREMLPHEPPMILLDEVIGILDDGLVAAVTIDRQKRFFVEGKGMPAYVGVEYMAQTCGLYAGYLALSQQQPVEIAYLLGTRDYQTACGWFAPGMRLLVRVKEVLREKPVGAFDCSIDCDGQPVATARLSVYQPVDPPVVARQD